MDALPQSYILLQINTQMASLILTVFNAFKKILLNDSDQNYKVLKIKCVKGTSIFITVLLLKCNGDV